MNIIEENRKRIYRKDNDYGTFYSMGLSKKQQDGTYLNGYIPVRFKKDVSLEDKTDIKIKNAWVDFYKSKNNETIIYIFINEFDIVSIDSKEVASKEMESEEVFNPNEIVLSNDDLPF